MICGFNHQIYRECQNLNLKTDRYKRCYSFINCLCSQVKKKIRIARVVNDILIDLNVELFQMKKYITPFIKAKSLKVSSALNTKQLIRCFVIKHMFKLLNPFL